eukprot:TRINITY_DN24570_c0_g1_i1.p2 TRINITY_DN24570_c0_g1~~TRINITY_DN24570_c0_g1_i1.p2  ORF type:complete len:131 (-),score=4.81 TRINITY_DN24570_c0_g1_i1:38-430(-)
MALHTLGPCFSHSSSNFNLPCGPNLESQLSKNLDARKRKLVSDTKLGGVLLLCCSKTHVWLEDVRSNFDTEEDRTMPALTCTRVSADASVTDVLCPTKRGTSALLKPTPACKYIYNHGTRNCKGHCGEGR